MNNRCIDIIIFAPFSNKTIRLLYYVALSILQLNIFLNKVSLSPAPYCRMLFLLLYQCLILLISPKCPFHLLSNGSMVKVIYPSFKLVLLNSRWDVFGPEIVNKSDRLSETTVLACINKFVSK